MNIRVYILILAIGLPMTLFSQQNRMGNWLMYFGSNKISEKWSVHTEFQFRNYTIATLDTEQLLLRTGLNYNLSDDAFLTAGYAFVPSYIYESDQKNPEIIEHRIWQQFIVKNMINKLKLEHRYRVEQRWVNGNYKNRFRYRLMAFVPLNKKKNKGKLFLGIYDEIFINSKKLFFDRNRLYVGLGYKINKNAIFQTGILHQQLNDIGKYYLQFSLTYNSDFRKKNSNN